MSSLIDADLKKHISVMDALRDKHTAINDAIGGRADVALIDYPAYFNTGDLLINWGTEAFFEKGPSRIVSRYAIGDLGKYYSGTDEFVIGRHIRQLDSDIEKGAILALHGGGSFGDLWSHHHKLREALLERYRGVKTIVLPQSIQFASRDKFDKSAKIFRDHGDVTIFVRDEDSLEFIEASGVSGGLLPDMAHHLWRTHGVFSGENPKGHGLLRQVRVDKEGAERATSNETFDWDDTFSVSDKIAHLLFSAWRRANPVARFFPSYKMWYPVRNRLIGKGISHFSKYKDVETDRLHGLILASLLSMRVGFDDRDNKYRKLNRYYKKWLSDSPLITSA